MKFVIPLMYTAISSVKFSCIKSNQLCLYTQSSNMTKFLCMEMDSRNRKCSFCNFRNFVLDFNSLFSLKRNFHRRRYSLLCKYIPLFLCKIPRALLDWQSYSYFYRIFIAALKNEYFQEGHETRTSRWSEFCPYTRILRQHCFFCKR